MRILLLGMYANAEGELSYEARMVHYLAQMGNEVDYWTDSPLSYMMEPVLKQPPTLRSFVFKEGKAALAKTPRQFHPLDVKKIMQEHTHHENPGYDVIFTTSQTGIDMGVWLKQVLGIPLVVQILDLPYWRIDQMGPWEIYRESVIPLPLLPHEMFDGYLNEWRWWLGNIKNVDLVTTIIEVAKQKIQEYTQGLTGERPENIKVSYHGSIDHETFDYFLQKEKVERKDQVLCINRIDFHKGVDQTVYVAKIIQDLMGPDAPEFVFVSRGNQPWYEQLVRDFAAHNLRKVRFTGWIDNPSKIRLIRQSKLMLDNEWPEGFGGCMLGEAIYCGTPALAWDRRSKLEVYPTGLRTVPHGDYEAMAKLAVEILRHNELHEPTDEAKAFIRDYRSNKSHAESINGLLKGVLGR